MRMQTCHSMQCARVRHKARPQHTACRGGGGGGGGESKQSGSAWPGLSAAMDGRAEALCHRLPLGCEYSREIAARPHVGVGRRTRLHAHGKRSAKRWPPHVSAVELGVGRFRHLQQIHHVATPHNIVSALGRLPPAWQLSRQSCLPVARRRQLLPPAITPYTARHGTAHAACCMLCCMYGCLVRAAAAQQRSRSSRGGDRLRCRTDGRAQTARRAAAACRTARPRRQRRWPTSPAVRRSARARRRRTSSRAARCNG